MPGPIIDFFLGDVKRTFVLSVRSKTYALLKTCGVYPQRLKIDLPSTCEKIQRLCLYMYTFK